jgi:hypothetical protein
MKGCSPENLSKSIFQNLVFQALVGALSVLHNDIIESYIVI